MLDYSYCQNINFQSQNCCFKEFAHFGQKIPYTKCPFAWGRGVEMLFGQILFESTSFLLGTSVKSCSKMKMANMWSANITDVGWLVGWYKVSVACSKVNLQTIRKSIYLRKDWKLINRRQSSRRRSDSDECKSEIENDTQTKTSSQSFIFDTIAAPVNVMWILSFLQLHSRRECFSLPMNMVTG